jgi:hypothetical protein
MSRTSRTLRPFLLLALALAAAACGADAATTQVISDDTGAPGIQAGYVRVASTATGLVVDNQTERPIYFMAVNAEVLALLDWAPCTGGASCPSLVQGAKREIPWASVVFYQQSAKQFTVYWWNVTVQPDGTARADNVHNVTTTR